MTAMLLDTLLTCPYCGHEQHQAFEHPKGHKIIYCDDEMGGCAKPYVVFWETKVLAKVYELAEPGPPDILK